MVGKQPPPKVLRQNYAEEADIDVDPPGKLECRERVDDAVTTCRGTGPEGPEWLSAARRLARDLDPNHMIGDELGEALLTDGEIYAPLPGRSRRIRTRLHYKRFEDQY